MTMRTTACTVAGLLLVAAAGLVPAAPATAASPSLTISGGFDQPSYRTGDVQSATLRVHNAGKRPTAGLFVSADYGPGELSLDQNGFGVLGDGVTVPAGGTVTVTVTGYAPDLTGSRTVLAGTVFDHSGNGVAHFSFHTAVLARTATVGGRVFDDVNGNGRADAGEGVAGVTVLLTYLYGSDEYRVTSGAGGVFSRVVPTATYYRSGSGQGLQVIQGFDTVAADDTDLLVQAVHPLREHVLVPTIRFAQATYAPGDTVHLTVTLKNTGSTPLSSIGAACDEGGDPDELLNDGTGWGRLALDGPGVSIAPGATRVVHVTDALPAQAQRFGEVVAACDFGYDGVDDGDRPSAIDRAPVPGAFGSVGGEIDYYPNGDDGDGVGVAGVGVVLVKTSSAGCATLIRRTTTDTDGTFRIAHVPPGFPYEVYLVPPAGFSAVDNPSADQIIGKSEARFYGELEQGSGSAPTLPARCTT